jgi:ribosomal protein S18 acetylase RimI-like enzyme
VILHGCTRRLHGVYAGSVEIRPGTAADAATLTSLNAHVHDLHVEAEPYRYRATRRDEVEAHFQAVLADPEADVLVATKAGEAVGYLVARVVRRPAHVFTAPYAYLLVDQLAVVPGKRRGGIGRALMAAAHQRALDRGLAHVELDVRSHNRSARAFYEALGYETVQRRLRLAL